MKKILPAFFCIVFNAFLSAQLPTIHGYTVIPTSPTSSSFIKIVTHVSTPNQSFHVDKLQTVSTNPNNINLHLCFGQNLPTVITHHTDTFAIGQLAPGVYPIKLSAYLSSAGQHCVRIDSNFVSTSITIAGNVGVLDNTTNNNTRLYPNPATDFITVESEGLKHIRILSLQGQLIRSEEQTSSKKISLVSLAQGVYLIELCSPNRKEVQRLIVQ